MPRVSPAFVERKTWLDVDLSRRRLQAITKHHSPTVDRTIQQMAPINLVALLDAERIRGEALAFEVVIAQARIAGRIAATLVCLVGHFHECFSSNFIAGACRYRLPST